MPTYNRVDLSFETGDGPYLITDRGARYLDFASGIATTNLGHGHPHLVKALQEQAGKLWHVSNLWRIRESERLAQRLAEATFADQVFFCNSGVEAFEAAIKLVRKYHDDSGQPNRYRVITVDGAFHGRSLNAISAAGSEKLLKGFAPQIDGFDHVGFNNTNELVNAITDETAAILVEPVQGDGGIRPADLQYLQALRRIADEHGLLLVFDEIQCGMGRTGKLFAHEWAGIVPDVMMSAKGLGGGMPIGACLATAEAAKGMTAGTHGSTFGGNPLATAVGNAVMDVMLEPGFLDSVDRVARDLWHRLQDLVPKHPQVIQEVRGAGLMLGIRCRDAVTNADLGKALRDQGLLTVPAADNVVRLLPPLVIDESHVRQAVEMIDAGCAQVAGRT
ncbi:MAG: aspartate aminotransferase family protein [Rhodovibrio sp.]|nr:aspartate aminotransferase family protein [Rhodovibrio sp.]